MTWTIQTEYSRPPVESIDSSITETDMALLRKECEADVEFDPHNMRNTMYHRAFYSNGVSSPVIVKETAYGKVCAILDNPSQVTDIPWDMWWRVLRMFYRGRKFNIFFMGHTSLRRFPNVTEKVGPHNINGGYTYRCNPDYVCIYRAEDATRVLIHELFHASCSDGDDPLDELEAKTEAWAELIYQALLSRGDTKELRKGIKKQSAWMMGQNRTLRRHFVMPKTQTFPWRYTIGKEGLWRQWGIFTNNVRPIDHGGSLRLTPPPTSQQCEREGVRPSSVIL